MPRPTEEGLRAAEKKSLLFLTIPLRQLYVNRVNRLKWELFGLPSFNRADVSLSFSLSHCPDAGDEAWPLTQKFSKEAVPTWVNQLHQSYLGGGGVTPLTRQQCYFWVDPPWMALPIIQLNFKKHQKKTWRINWLIIHRFSAKIQAQSFKHYT